MVRFDPAQEKKIAWSRLTEANQFLTETAQQLVLVITDLNTIVLFLLSFNFVENL